MRVPAGRPEGFAKESHGADRRRGRALQGGFLALLLAGAMAPPASAQTFLGAHADLECGQCHAVDAEGNPVTPIELLAEQEAICNACHEDFLGRDHADGHPTGFVPARSLPSAYPLNADGRFTCSSCHGVHDDTPFLLRGGGGWACRDCH